MQPLVRLAQSEAALGNLDANLARHVEAVEAAVRDGVDLLILPELSLTGYFLKDQTADVALALDSEPVRRLAELSREVSICFGFVERARDGRLFNAMAFCEDGRVLGVHRKVHLVTYGMFEEDRDLAAGDRFDVIESRHGRIGLLTCEDAWHMDGAYLHFLAGADVLVVASAGPGRGVEARTEDEEEPLASNRVWHTLQDAMALWTRTPVLYVNRVGWEDGIVFGGSSRAVHADGRPMAAPLGLDPGHLDVRLDPAVTRRAREATPLRRDQRPWILLRGLSEHVGLGPRGDEAPARHSPDEPPA